MWPRARPKVRERTQASHSIRVEAVDCDRHNPKYLVSMKTYDDAQHKDE